MKVEENEIIESAKKGDIKSFERLILLYEKTRHLPFVQLLSKIKMSI